MIKLGRYKIAFGRTAWIQTLVPTTVRHFICFWIFKEAKPSDFDKKQQFPLGTPLKHNGRVYRYWKAEHDIPVSRYVARYVIKEEDDDNRTRT